VPIVTRAIARRAAERRVALMGAPSVQRSASEVDVQVKVRGDRARAETQVLDALSAIAAGLRDNPTTPAQSRLEVALETNQRGAEHRRFRSPGAPVALYLDRRLGGPELWSSYVEEVKAQQGAQRMGFSDEEASGHAPAGPDAPEPDDNQALAVLAQNFSAIGACARAEAGRSRSFRGVTVGFRWLPSGRIEGAQAKQPKLRGSPVERCLRTALDGIRLPRFSGEPRTIEYPIRVK
jgi:hypothetical protein